MVTVAVIYDKIGERFTVPELVLFGLAAVMAIAIINAAAAWFYARPREILDAIKLSIGELGREGSRLHYELRTTLTEALERQPYVSEDMLALIEERADGIWVVSTDLRNDIRPGKIRASVEENLKKGKNYTYFIPSPTNPNFPDAGQNERAYKDWTVYKERSAQIKFVHLPDDTLFLFREVVIYNPIADANAQDEKITKGFTYFDTTQDSRDRLMKVPDTYLHFLRGQLHRYSDDVGLVTEIERLLKELKGRLSDSNVLYLANLMSEGRIQGRNEFLKLIEGVRERDAYAAEKLLNALKKYIDRSA